MTAQPTNTTVTLTKGANAETLSPYFGFRNQDEILRYLEDNPFLVPLLIETYYAVQCYFGSGTPILLEVMHAPEGNDPGGLLFAQIQSSEPVESTLAKMDRF